MLSVLFSLFALDSFAAEDFNSDELSYTGFRWTVVDGKVQESDITSSVTVTHNSVLGVPTINYTIPTGSSDTKTQGLIAFKTQSLKSKHEYNLKFGFATGHPSVCSFLASLVFYDSNNNVIRQQDIVVVNEGIKNNELYYIDVNFIPNVEGLSSGFRTELQFCFLSGTVYANTFRLTQEISLTDTDDNSGFVDGIWGTIKHIFIAIVGGECQDGDYSSPGLFGKLRDGFDNLGNRIGTFFDNLKTSIEAKIDSIQQWFIDLGNNILDGIREALKWAFVPKDGFFEEYLDRFYDLYESHFGIFGQCTTLFIRVVNKIDSILVDTYSFTFPELYITIENHHYTFVPEQTVNIGQWLSSGSWSSNLYKMYRVAASAILIICVLSYARRVEETILGESESFINQEV